MTMKRPPERMKEKRARELVAGRSLIKRVAGVLTNRPHRPNELRDKRQQLFCHT